MAVSVTLKKPRRFSREAYTLIGGGAASGVVVTGLDAVAGDPVPQLAVLSFGAIVGLIANLVDSGEGTPMLRLVLAILAGGAMALLLPIHWALVGGVGGILLGAAFCLEDGDSPLERAFFVSVYGLLLAAGVFTTTSLVAGVEAGIVSNVFQGLTWGLFLGLAGGLKRLEWSRDSVLAQYKEVYADVGANERETVHQGRVLYEQICQEVSRIGDVRMQDRAREIATETSQALLALTRRAQELRVAAERTSQRQLEARVVSLDERIAKTRDEKVRTELSAALDELVEQVKVRKRLDVARARIEARQQRCFTALERLHVALIQSGAGSADASVHESIENLEKLSEEIHWRNLSVDELCAGNACGTEDVDTDDIVAQMRAALEPMPIEDATRDDEPTVLEGLSDGERQVRAEEPAGTDGSVAAHEEEVSATSHHD